MESITKRSGTSRIGRCRFNSYILYRHPLQDRHLKIHVSLETLCLNTPLETLMQKTRRNFIIGTGAALLGSALEHTRADTASTSAPDITTLLESSGFTPGGPNSALLAIIGDLHINLEAGDAKFTDHFDDALVAELNALRPSITDLTIVGDLIVHNSVSIGGSRYSSHYELSRLEFRKAKAQIQRFRPTMAVRAVPGNHDTDKDETDAELWREELQMVPYQKSTLGGVPVFCLNSGHAGMPDLIQWAWFELEASLIPPKQEVVIIAHHPSFFYVYEEIGLKRIVAQAFAKHQAPVWLIGGHGHSFGEQLLVSGSAKFVQMEVTTGNPKQWGDSHSPGYALLALQNGSVIHRAFRGINESGFQSLQQLNQLKPYPLKWVFDTIDYPAAVFEEGFYDRAGRLVNFTGIDLKSHISLCRSYLIRVDLSKSKGKISDYLLPANIWSGYAPPSCDFSDSGPNGPWVSGSFPTRTGQQVYVIPIPPEFRNSPNLHIRTKTQLQGSYDGITVYGWGLAAAPESLTGYEKWLSKNYRTIFQNDQTSPTSKPSGSNITNIEHYAFNIPLPSSNLQMGSSTGSIFGLPSYMRTFRNVSSYSFARRSEDSQPMVSYALEKSFNLTQWTNVSDDQLAITPFNNGWEEVRTNIPIIDGIPVFFRVGVTPRKSNADTRSYITSGDLDSNEIDDLIQYAFNLQSENGLMPIYDPEQTNPKPGLPHLGRHQELYSAIRYARLRKSANSGVNYRIEESTDIKAWTILDRRFIAERIVRTNGDWDEVEAIIINSTNSSRTYRVSLDLTEPLPQSL